MHSLKTLGADKAEFNNWNEKLINAMTQTLGAPRREFMRALNQKLDVDRKILDDQELGNFDGATAINNAGKSS